MQETFVSSGEHYDAYSANARGDLSFWVRRARHAGDPVLELACGTGRISIPMAEAGAVVSGLDASPAFLDLARSKAALRGLDVDFQHGDMRSFRIAKSFQLIAIPFRGISVLLSFKDLSSCFQCCRDHLLPGASLVIDTFNTPDETYSRRAEQRSSYRDPEGGGLIEVIANSDYDATSRIVRVAYTLRREGTPDVFTQLALRHHSAGEIISALEEAGLAITAHVGTYDGSQRTRESPTQILVDEKR
jgi:SAM-dependent methyltransferase